MDETIHPAPVRKETRIEKYWRHEVYRKRYDPKKPVVVLKQDKKRGMFR